jgi:hypothetical protein
MTPPDTITLAVVAAVAALVVGVLRTSVGGGIGVTLTPILILFMPAPTVLGLIGLLVILSDPISLRYFWRQWDGAQLRLLMPASVVGVLVGAFVLAGLPERQLKHLIGLAALTLALAQLPWLLARVRRVHELPLPVGLLVGFVSGIASVIAHSGGIIATPYLAARGLSNAQVVGTYTPIQAVANVVKIAAYWSIGFLDDRLIIISLAMLPLLYAGSWLGFRVNAWLPRRAFALAMIVIAVAGSLRLLLG